jgi:hypothetical protein
LLDSLLYLLAHGADPRPIRPDEAAANMVKFFVTITVALLMSYPVLAPLFPKRAGGQQQPSEASDANTGLIGWLALGLCLVLSMAWWLTRTSIVELTTKETPKPDHAHTQERGGQVAMWGDFHAEVARIESGEVRVYLTDSYNRPIAARFFDAEIVARPLDDPTETSPAADGSAGPAVVAQATPATAAATAGVAVDDPPHPTIAALDDSYRFARMDRDDKAYRVRINTPGWSVTLKFAFDGDDGRRSLPIWCGTPP